MVSEAFVLGDKDFRLPGLGSYMSVAVAKGDSVAMVWAVVAMTLMIVVLDQLLWRPVVVWAQKFRVEEGANESAPHSWVLDLLIGSRLVQGAAHLWKKLRRDTGGSARKARPSSDAKLPSSALSTGLFVLLALGMAFGAFKLAVTLRSTTAGEWLRLGEAGLATLGRVLLSTVIGTAWAVPAGLAIGLSPRLSRLLQPVVQVVASFPAPMLFPIVVGALRAAGVTLGWGSIVLMLLGTQWYILFNVIAGASAIPSDLREAARMYRFGRWARFSALYLPAVFPHLVTGWVTAAGGAWNASIVSEYVALKGETLTTWGLGAQISEAASLADFPRLAASVLAMSVLVVTWNRLVWRPLNEIAETRFSLSK
jgi:NitT/TauT family transport system permease protein